MSQKSTISKMHSLIITYVFSHYVNTRKYKQQIVDALNLVTYNVYSYDPTPFSWDKDSPLDSLPNLPNEDEFMEVLGDIYLTIDGIDWSELKPTHDFLNTHQESPKPVKQTAVTSNQSKSNDKKSKVLDVPKQQEVVIKPTPKQDLYIQPPTVPQFDYKKPWMKCVDGPDSLVIYTTLPEIPTRQNEISVTTDVNRMTRKELMNLYPNHLIHTRASIMYEELDGVELHPEFGLILPIEGYTREQLVENIIKYPHIFKLLREVDNQFYSFYTHIEIDGELVGILDVWDNLPESKVLPRNKEFVKEYVVRRYLLERDIKHIKHKYPIHGTFDSFLTLFMPADSYIKYGYNDVESLARQCVSSRVSYKQSRNPVIRRMMQHV